MNRIKIKQMIKPIMVLALASSLATGIATDVMAIERNTGMYSLKQKMNAIMESSGYLEGAAIEWEAIAGATAYNVYYKSADEAASKYEKLDNELIRQYPSNLRADILGLAEGKYNIKIVPVIGEEESVKLEQYTTVDVKAHTREGFAFSENSKMKTGSGGYNDDGTVAENAQILYVTAENINTITQDVITNSKGSTTKSQGLVNILTNRGKGYDKRPLIIRMIGEIKGTDIEGLNSNGYVQIKGCYNTTFEGVGEDATVNGWGFLIRSSYNVELRNVGIMLFPDDAISLDTGNENIWVHNNDIFYGAAGSDADQVKGDGSADVKGKSTNVTISYNHFYDSGKASLCGMNDTEEFFVTYHHNWFDHSDSRHPRIRVGTVHIYNNYFDGNSKYGVGVTKGSSAFVEANDFRNCKYPMLSSLQGSDISGGSKGNFSGEAGGMIKAYNNKVSGAKSLVYANSNPTQFDAYLAETRNELVSSSYSTLSGGNTYNNFDTSSEMYSYTPDDVEDVREEVTTYAGRTNSGDFEWKFTSEDDAEYAVNEGLMVKIKNYISKLVSIGGDNITVVPVLPEVPETPEVPEIPQEPVTPEIPEDKEEGEKQMYNHNFTTDELVSDFFAIKGNTSTTKGTVKYEGLTLTKCLKIESSTSIKFTTTSNTNLVLVFNSNFNKSILIDGVEYKATNGIVNVELDNGLHEIKKADSCNLYYIKLA